MINRKKLPATRNSITHKVEISTESGMKDFYIIVGLYANGKPGELFAKEGQSDAPMLDQWCRAVSIMLQDGHDTEDLVKKFGYAKYEPSGLTDCKLVRTAFSITDYIVRWLHCYFSEKEIKDGAIHGKSS